MLHFLGGGFANETDAGRLPASRGLYRRARGPLGLLSAAAALAGCGGASTGAGNPGFGTRAGAEETPGGNFSDDAPPLAATGLDGETPSHSTAGADMSSAVPAAAGGDGSSEPAGGTAPEFFAITGEDADIDISGAFDFPAGASVKYRAQMVADNADLSSVGLSIDEASGKISGKFTGTEDFDIRVTAAQGRTRDEKILTISANPAPANTVPTHDPERLPEIDVLQHGSEVDGIDVSGAFADPDGDDLEFSATGLDGTGLSMTASGVISGQVEAVENIDIEVTAFDGKGGEITATITLVVNQAPEKTDSAVFDGVLVAVGASIDPISVAAAFRDPDGDALSFTVTGLPEGLSYDAGMKSITGEIAEPGFGTVTVVANDQHGGTVTSTFSITAEVQNRDSLLTGTLAPNLVLSAGAQIKPIDVSDAFVASNEGASPTFSAPDLQGTGLSITAAGVISGTFTAAVGGDIAVRATYADGVFAETVFTIVLSAESGHLVGTSGDDVLFGGVGDGTLAGEAGDDTFHIGAGDESVYGYRANDFGGDTGTDTVVFGGNQTDYGLTVEWREANSDGSGDWFASIVVDDLNRANGHDGEDRLFGIDEVRFADKTFRVSTDATDGNDLLIGAAGETNGGTIDGLAGDDRIIGGQHADILVGGAGSDVFDGQGGGDTLHGHTATDNGPDTDIDIALYRDNRDSYEVEIESSVENGGTAITVFVKSVLDGDRDTLRGIEKIRFSDAVIDVSDLLDLSATRLPDVVLTTGTDSNLPIDAASGFISGGGALTYGATADGVNLADAGIGLAIDSESGVISGRFAGSETVVVVVRAANANGFVEDSFTVRANAAPMFDSGNLLGSDVLQRGSEIDPIDVGGEFADADGDDLEFSAIGLDGTGLSFGPDGVIHGPLDAGGDIRVEVTASDGRGGSVVGVVVLRVNEKPEETAAALPDLTSGRAGTEMEAIDVGAAFRDPDGDVLTITVTGLPDGLEFNATTGLITGEIPRNAEIGISTVGVHVDDQMGGVVTDTFQIQITDPANGAPVVNKAAARDFVLTTGSSARLPIDAGLLFSDPDGDSLTYGATVGGVALADADIGLSIDAKTGMISGVFTGTGDMAIVVRAVDVEGAVAQAEIAVAVNTAPAFDGSSLPASIVFQHGLNEEIDVSAAFVDPDGNDPTFSATGLEGTGLSITPEGVIRGAATGTDDIPVEVTASDGRGGSVAETIVLKINENPEPVDSAPLGDVTVMTGGEIPHINLKAAFRDPDGDAMTIAVIGLPDGLEYDAGTGLVTGKISHDDAGGNWTVQVRVEDGRGGGTDASFDISALLGNREPELVGQQLPDVRVSPGNGRVSVETSGRFADPDGDTLTFGATAGGDNAALSTVGLEIDPMTGRISGDFTGDESSTITVRANDADGSGGFVEDSFTVALNRNPTFDLERMSTPLFFQHARDNDLDISAAFADPDGDGLRFSATGFEDTGLSITAAGVIRGTVTTDDDIVAMVTASDIFGGSITGSITFGINRAPELISFDKVELNDVIVTTGVEINWIDVKAAFFDPDGDALSFKVPYLHEGLTFDEATGRIQGRIPHSAAGSKTVKVEASDGRGGKLEKTFDIDAQEKLPNMIVKVGTEINDIDLSGEFADGNAGDSWTFTSSDFAGTGLSISGNGMISGTFTGFASNDNNPEAPDDGVPASEKEITITATRQDGGPEERSFILKKISRDEDILGTDGYDLVFGTSDVDNPISGGAGSDTFYASAGTDHIYGYLETREYDRGIDKVVYDGDHSDYLLDLQQREGGNDGGTFSYTQIQVWDQIGADGSVNRGYLTGIEVLIFDDVTFRLSTEASDDAELLMSGTPGDADQNLNGLGGNDRIVSRGGDDTIQGGAGSDWVHGGVGDDTYYANTKEDHAGADEDIDTAFFEFKSEEYTIAGQSYLENGETVVRVIVNHDKSPFAAQGITYGEDALYGFDKIRFRDKTIDVSDIDISAAPILSDPPLADVILTTGTSARLPIHASGGFHDADGDALTYSAVVDGSGDLSTLGLTIDSASGEISGIYTGTEIATVTVTATDEASSTPKHILSVSDSFLITPNTAPVFDAGNLPDFGILQSGAQIDPIDVSAAFTDPDGDPLTFTAADLADIGLEIAVDGMIDGLLSARDNIAVEVTASDGNGGVVSGTVMFAVNEAPEETGSLGDQVTAVTGRRQISVNVAEAFTDPDGDALTISVTGLADSGLTYGSGHGYITGLIDHAKAGESWTIEAAVIDGRGGAITKTFVITAQLGNRDPEVAGDGLPDVVLTTGTVANLPINAADGFTDPDDDPLTYSATVGDDRAALSTIGLQIDSATGTISGTFVGTGTARVTVVAADHGGSEATVADDFLITANMSPVYTDGNLPSPIVMQYDMDDAVNVSAAFSDPDGDALTFTAPGLAGTGLGITAAGVIEGRLAVKDDIVVNVTASDGRGGSVTEAVTLVVNEAPVETGSLGDEVSVLTGRGEISVDVDGAFRDPDGDALTISVTGLADSGLTYGSTPGHITGLIDHGKAGESWITEVAVSDGQGGLTIKTFVITAQLGNRDPEVVGDGLSDVVLTAGTAFNLPINAADGFTDPDDDPLTYSATVGDDLAALSTIGLRIDSATGAISGTFAGTEDVTVTVRAVDNGGSGAAVTDDFLIIANAVPTFDSGAVEVGILQHGEDIGNVDISAAFMDSDGDDLEFTAPRLGDIGLEITAGGVIRGRVESTVDMVDVDVTASDGRGGRVTGVIALEINEAPEESGAGLSDRVSILTGHGIDPINVGSAFRDPDGDPLNIAVTGLPAGLTFSAATGLITGNVARHDQADTEWTVSVRVEDGRGGVFNDVFAIDVKLGNFAPVLSGNRIPDVILTAGTDWNLPISTNAAFTDPEDDPLTYSAMADGSRLSDIGLEIDSTTGVISGTFTGTEDATVTVRATDETGNGGFAEDAFIITANRGPTEIALPDRVDAITAASSSDQRIAPINLNAAFSDPDGDALTFTVTGLPAGLMFDVGTGVISGTVDNSVGTAVVTAGIVVDDGRGGSLVEELIFDVTANQGPVVLGSGLADRIFTIGTNPAFWDREPGFAAPISISALFDDPDGSVSNLRYEATVNGVDLEDMDLGLTLNDDMLMWDDLARWGTDRRDDLADRGLLSFTIEVVATDVEGSELSESDEFVVTINTAPVPNSSSVPVMHYDGPGTQGSVDLTPSFSDPDGDDVIFEGISTAGIGALSRNGVLKGEITPLPGTVQARVTVSDGRGGRSEHAVEFLLNHRPQSLLPDILGYGPDGDIGPFNLRGAFRDPDGDDDAMTFEFAELPEGVVLNYDETTGMLTGAVSHSGRGNTDLSWAHYYHKIGRPDVIAVEVTARDARGGGTTDILNLALTREPYNVIVSPGYEIQHGQVNAMTFFKDDSLSGRIDLSATISSEVSGERRQLPLSDRNLEMNGFENIIGLPSGNQDMDILITGTDSHGNSASKTMRFDLIDGNKAPVWGTDGDDLFLVHAGVMHGRGGDDVFEASLQMSEVIYGHGLAPEPAPIRAHLPREHDPAEDDGFDTVIYRDHHFQLEIEVRWEKLIAPHQNWWDTELNWGWEIWTKYVPYSELGQFHIDKLYGVEELRFNDKSFVFTTDATEGNDLLSGDVQFARVEQGEILDGLGGDDWVVGHSGRDILIGGAGSDALQGNGNSDVLYGHTPGDNGPDTDVDIAFFNQRSWMYNVYKETYGSGEEYATRVIVEVRQNDPTSSDGRSTLYGIERLKFSGGGTMEVDSLPTREVHHPFNRLPELAAEGELEDLIITEGGETVQIDASRAFTDPDGDTLTYSARVTANVPWRYEYSTHNMPNIEHVNTGLTIDSETGLVTGTYDGPRYLTVVVRATDPEGLFIEDEFAVTMHAAPDPAFTIYGSNRDDGINGARGAATGGILPYHDTKIYGGDGSDKIFGGQGDDIIDGGARDDVAIYTGFLYNYNMWKEGDTYYIEDRRRLEDGHDELINIEKLHFLTEPHFVSKRVNLYDLSEGITFGIDDAMHFINSEANVMYGGDGYNGINDDWFYGSDGDDVIYAGHGPDKIYGGEGDDIINGGAGDDVAAYIGSIDDYVIWEDNGKYYVRDQHIHRGGTDVLTDVEGLYFFNGGRLWLNHINERNTIDIDDAILDFNSPHGDERDPIWWNVGAGRDGTSFNDLVLGSHSHDANHGPMLGKDGDDIMYGFTGSDLMSGGLGNDRIHGGNGSDTIHGNKGDDFITGGDRLLVESSPTDAGEFVYGPHDDGRDSRLDDTIYGDDGNDIIFGNTGDDYIDGGTGNDNIHGDDARDPYGAGDDRIYGGIGDDVINGGLSSKDMGREYFEKYDVPNERNDISNFAERTDMASKLIERGDVAIYSGSRDDYHFWADENDNGVYHILDRTFSDGYEGSDTITGIETLLFLEGNPLTSGDHDLGTYVSIDDMRTTTPYSTQPTISGGRDGTDWEDAIYGTGGDDGFDWDYVSGKDGSDKIYGYGGADKLSGGYGQDRIAGGDGNDIIYGGNNNDTIYGGNLSGVSHGDDNDVIYGGDGSDKIYGGHGNDSIDGGSSDFDVAIYSGSREEYLITLDENGYRIRDKENNRDGEDTITNVEYLQFTNGDRVKLYHEMMPEPEYLDIDGEEWPTDGERFNINDLVLDDPVPLSMRSSDDPCDCFF